MGVTTSARLPRPVILLIFSRPANSGAVLLLLADPAAQASTGALTKPPAVGAPSTQLITVMERLNVEDLVSARRMLDEAANQRGRERLMLGARVPESVPTCWLAGLDVETWVKNGWIRLSGS